MNSKLQFWMMAAAAFVFAASSVGSAYAGPSTEPCSLLYPSQVSTVLGVTVGAGKHSGKADRQWSQTSASSHGKGVLVEIVGPMGQLTPVDRFNTIKMPSR